MIISLYIVKRVGIDGLNSFDGGGSLGSMLSACFNNGKSLLMKFFKEKYGQCFSLPYLGLFGI